jgi:hypothetical protein
VLEEEDVEEDEDDNVAYMDDAALPQTTTIESEGHDRHRS